MSSPTTAPPLPPTPDQAAKVALGNAAANMAKNHAMNKARSELKQWVPSVLHPLIPGEKGTVSGKIQTAVSKRFWSFVWGLIFSIVFFAIFGFAVLCFVLIVVYALLTS